MFIPTNMKSKKRIPIVNLERDVPVITPSVVEVVPSSVAINKFSVGFSVSSISNHPEINRLIQMNRLHPLLASQLLIESIKSEALERLIYWTMAISSLSFGVFICYLSIKKNS